MDRWLGKLEASNWLTHIKEILTTACLAAQCIDRYCVWLPWMGLGDNQTCTQNAFKSVPTP